ncbi:hypothetical protein, partial [Chloroflexus islandicus]|uniref:hypothetical protein n=1 Tax=Chloroflexus islandicus TaxID=1707952 RepID=UPI001C12BE6A
IDAARVRALSAQTVSIRQSSISLLPLRGRRERDESIPKSPQQPRILLPILRGFLHEYFFISQPRG